MALPHAPNLAALTPGSAAIAGAKSSAFPGQRRPWPRSLRSRRSLISAGEIGKAPNCHFPVVLAGSVGLAARSRRYGRRRSGAARDLPDGLLYRGGVNRRTTCLRSGGAGGSGSKRSFQFPSLPIAPPTLLSWSMCLLVGMWHSDVAGTLAVAACAFLGAKLGKETSMGRSLTGPVCAMAVGVIAVQVLPAPASLPVLQKLVNALATPMLLLSCNLKEVLGRKTRRVLGAFAFGTLGSCLGGLLGAVLLQGPLSQALGSWPVVCSVASALTAKNIGSGLNFLAIVEALSVPSAVVALALVVDNILGLIYFPIASGLMPSPDSAAPEQAEVGPGKTDDAKVNESSAGGAWLDAASTLVVAGVIAVVSKALAPAALVHVMSAAIAVVTATATSGVKGFLKSGDSLGESLLYVYFATAGFTAGRISPSLLLTYWPLMLFGLTLYVIHFIVVLGGGPLSGLKRTELLLASNANIGGPASASMMAMAKGRSDLARPALLVGMLGNAVGTALGLAFNGLMRALTW